MDTPMPAADVLLYRVPEAARVLGISEASAYRLIRADALAAVTVVGKTRVTRRALEAYVRSLEAARERENQNSTRLLAGTKRSASR